MANFKEVVAGIKTLNDAEVKVAIAALNARIKQLRDQKAETFSVGQKVTFNSKRAGTVTGIVEKVNKATIIVNSYGMIWRVSPQLLKAM